MQLHELGAAVITIAVLTQDPALHRVSGRATVYYPGDGHCGSERADGKRFRPTDAHIAHRSLPLGTRGRLCSLRTGRCIETVVRDRGPFGAKRPCRAGPPAGRARLARWGRVCYWWQMQIKLQPGWERRGEFDLTRPVARAIGHRAFDRVVFFYRRRQPPES